MKLGKIRKRTLILTIAVISGFFLVLYAVSSAILTQSFAHLERREVTESLERLENVISREQSNLESIAIDWSMWNDTYRFIQDRNEEYVASNLLAETFVSLDINIIVFLNLSGSAVYTNVYSTDTYDDIQFPEDIMAHLAPEGLIFRSNQEENRVTGFLNLESGTLLIAACPILKSNGEGPPMGTLLMGRWLDDAMLRFMENATSLTLSYRTSEELQGYLELGETEFSELNSTGMTILPLSGEIVAGYLSVKDIYGNNALIFRAELPRHIFQQGQITLLYILSSFAVVSLMLGILTIGLLESHIISRLNNLEKEVVGIASSKNPSGRVSVNGDDEISSLATNINRMIESLEHARAYLEESEQRYRAIVEQQTENICRFTPDFVITFANDAFCRYLNRNREAIIGESFLSLIPDDYKQTLITSSRSLSPDHPTVAYDHPVTTPNGIRWMRSAQTGIFDQNGVVVEYQLVGRDVTEEKRIESELQKYREHLEDLVRERTKELEIINKELQSEIAERKRIEKDLVESEKRYRSVVEDQTELIVRHRPDGTIAFVNPAFCKFFGKEERELIGTPFLQRIANKDRELLGNSIGKLSPSLPVTSSEVEVLDHRGERAWILWTHRGIFDDDGRLIEIQSVGLNITDRIKLMNEVIKIQKLESIGMLAGGIAHEFNNLFTAILSNIALAKLNMPENTVAYQRLTATERSIWTARNLTQQLLTFSKGGEPIKEVTEVKEIIEGALKLVPVNPSVEYDLAIDDNVSPVDVDKGQMMQVLANIIMNAHEAMPGGGKITITARNSDYNLDNSTFAIQSQYVIVSVVDSGIGIPPENLSRIFDPFFTTKTHGKGLGLSVAHSVVKKHGGHIEVESEIGKGTVFRIYLPAANNKKIETKTMEQVETPASTKALRILLMDDEEDILEVISEMLKQAGYEVDCSKEGRETIEKYKRAIKEGKPFDIVIMDLIVREGMSGKEAMKELLEIDPNVKAIVSSGYSNDPVMAEYGRFGFSGVLPKPYSMKELIDAVNKITAEKMNKGKATNEDA